MGVQDRYNKFVTDQRDFFNTLITEDWETYKSEEWDAVRQYEVAHLFELVQPKSILDIGCGCGFHDKVMADYEFVESIHAIDYSAESILRAEKSYPHPKVSRFVKDLSILAPDKLYQPVVSFQVIEHLKDIDAYFSTAHRLCEDNGHVAVFTPNYHRLGNMLRRARLKKMEVCDPMHFREYTVKELIKISSKHGLKFVETFGYGLNGLGWLDTMPIGKRLLWGKRLPKIANCFCLILRK